MWEDSHSSRCRSSVTPRIGGEHCGSAAKLHLVSRSGFYAWNRRPPSKRDVADSRLVPVIRACHAQSRATYGSARVHKDLQALDYHVSRERVARLMRREALSARPPPSLNQRWMRWLPRYSALTTCGRKPMGTSLERLDPLQRSACLDVRPVRIKRSGTERARGASRGPRRFFVPARAGHDGVRGLWARYSFVQVGTRPGVQGAPAFSMAPSRARRSVSTSVRRVASCVSNASDAVA